MQKLEYAVLDDYGDEWRTASPVFQSDSLQECCDWAEDNGFHSASVIAINEDGKRLAKVA